VLRLWERESLADPDIWHEVTRFNEAVDSATAEAASRVGHAMARYRDQSLAILGHDLRNPLGAITMCAQVISRSEVPDGRTSRLASRILSSADRMTRMVGELLDLTRTRLGVGLSFTVGPMDLAPLCRQVLGELEALHPARVVRFVATGDLRGEWDADRLGQMISNLAGNAIQHGNGQPIRVAAREAGEDVVLDFHNVGRTIDPDALDAIFEPFVRGPASAEDQGSTSMGLGLYIAREIVAAHGGTIEVTSTAEAGTTFQVRLPRHPRPVTPAPVPARGLREPGRAPTPLH
jgi:signal transduction histidine kinase